MPRRRFTNTSYSHLLGARTKIIHISSLSAQCPLAARPPRLKLVKKAPGPTTEEPVYSGNGRAIEGLLRYKRYQRTCDWVSDVRLHKPTVPINWDDVSAVVRQYRRETETPGFLDECDVCIICETTEGHSNCVSCICLDDFLDDAFWPTDRVDKNKNSLGIFKRSTSTESCWTIYDEIGEYPQVHEEIEISTDDNSFWICAFNGAGYVYDISQTSTSDVIDTTMYVKPDTSPSDSPTIRPRETKALHHNYQHDCRSPTYGCTRSDVISRRASIQKRSRDRKTAARQSRMVEHRHDFWKDTWTYINRIVGSFSYLTKS